ncbi:MAG: type II toxin-antitoxin system death-on-curing family toxin [Acidobacteriota bacterium]|nr:MAG: type II toxin-antitoxin system death-on-curing family toxin [Acidobacteriota bacterium]
MTRFVPLPAVLAIHAEVIRDFGGRAGLRDGALLESALARPRNREAYEGSDVFGLAAAYAYGIIRNHPFIDGNKRVGFLCAFVFLSLNGFELDAPEEEAVIVIEGVADGSVDEKTLAEWLRDHAS